MSREMIEAFIRNLKLFNAKERDHLMRFAYLGQSGPYERDVPPILSSRLIWSPIPQTKEIGREEAFFRRTDHRLSA